uniref:NADH-ubiquinone oxidoreductase chain 2 n=1 Tax=Gymnochthebius lividus TaxID=2107372 RepID=A0A7H0DK28_9COLE|nr:NADH dehydrogenase subunit 2 [Gymnochthebius lividus]QNP09688.1 NADH dehydrogenase subunit 2 [Gymnochthebius lividus]
MFYKYKMMFLLLMMIGTLISISSYSWFGMWMGLEINLLSIIPLLNNTKNMMANEATLKYFITQVLASTILLFSIITLSSNYLEWNNNIMMILNSSILTKMGAAPFHFWFPEVMEGLNWMNCLLMLTWQKLAPMILVMYNINMMVFFMIIICLSMLISGLMGVNQISLRKIMAYSSINHIAWMISSMLFLESIWMLYFIIYSIISLNLIFIFKFFNIFYLKQLFLSMNKMFYMKFFFILNMLSLGGLPPFLGFLPKWLTIQILISNNIFMMPLIMLIMTLFTLYFYMRVTFTTLMLSMNEVSYQTINFYKNYILMLFNFITINSLLFSTLIFNFY